MTIRTPESRMQACANTKRCLMCLSCGPDKIIEKKLFMLEAIYVCIPAIVSYNVVETHEYTARKQTRENRGRTLFRSWRVIEKWGQMQSELLGMKNRMRFHKQRNFVVVCGGCLLLLLPSPTLFGVVCGGLPTNYVITRSIFTILYTKLFSNTDRRTEEEQN